MNTMVYPLSGFLNVYTNLIPVIDSSLPTHCETICNISEINKVEKLYKLEDII